MDRKIKLACGGGIRSLQYENQRLKEELRTMEELLRRERRERKKRSARIRAHANGLALLARANGELMAAEQQWRNKCESLEASLRREQAEKMLGIHTGAHKEDDSETFTPLLPRPSPTPPAQPSSYPHLLSYYPSSSSNSLPPPCPYPVSYYLSPAFNFYPYPPLTFTPLS